MVDNTLGNGNAPLWLADKGSVLRFLAKTTGNALLLLASGAQLFLVPQPVLAQCCAIAELQPKYGRGGRTVAIAISPGNLNTVVVASFSGGLFKSSDAGTTWHHMDSLLPNRIADVKFDPEDENILIASVQVDSHNPSYSGIWRSQDGGQTWTPKNTDMPPCDTPPHPALGGHISFGPGPNAFVATFCGLAVSHDKGVTWSHPFYDSAPGERPAVTSVISRPGPQYPADPNSVIVDFCGVNGPRRSTDNAATFGPLPAAPNYPLGYCSIATSPYEPFVLLAVSNAGILWESDDANGSWFRLKTFSPGARPPWVLTRRAFTGDDTVFNLYFHDGGDLWRIGCNVLNSGPAKAGVALRCPQNTSGDSWSTAGMHDHHAEGFSLEDCTILDANDTGMSRSVCGPPWSSINDGLGALQIYDMAGTVHPDHTDLFIGTQDNYVRGSVDTGLTWPFLKETEGFNLQAPHARSTDDEQVSGNACAPCFTFVSNPQLNNLTPPWNPPSAVTPQAWLYLVGGGDGNSPTYATTGGPCTINGISTNVCLYACDSSGNCQAKVGGLPALATQHLYVAGPPANPTIYAVTAKGTNSIGQGIRGLIRIQNFSCPSSGCPSADNGLGSLYIWAPDDNPYDYPVSLGVDPSNPMHLIAADLNDETMKFSLDGGASWKKDGQLSALVTNNGQLQFHTPFLGLQTHVIAFDPSNGQNVLVGTEANGVIASLDGGTSWFKIAGSEQIPAISDFFFDEVGHTIYVSSYGRGLWTITNLVPETGDFSLSAMPIMEKPVSCTGTTNVHVASVGGFNGRVTLTADTSKTILDATFSPDPTQKDSKLFVRSDLCDGWPTSITVTGTSGSLSHSIAVPIVPLPSN
jgi:hypothetical protein